jgi:fatty acid desaturase
MAGEMNEQELRKKAEKRVEETQGFKANLISYVVVNLVIFIIWLVIALAGGTWFPWFLFPLLGWGIGIAFHGWSVYSDRYGESNEKRVQEEMERMKAAQSGVTDKE